MSSCSFRSKDLSSKRLYTMALPAFRGLMKMQKFMPITYPKLPHYSVTIQIMGATKFVNIHRWKHHTNFHLNLKPRCSVEFSQSMIDLKSLAISLRFLSTRQQCLKQREEKTLNNEVNHIQDTTSPSDAEVDHIQKELEVENKLTRKQRRAASDPKNSMINVGRFVTDKILELIDEDGTSLGAVNRNQAISLSQEKKLKLVLLKPGAKPWPVYKLMTGQELHEQQVKRNEKVKKKTAPTQLKEIKASWNIGQHDIAVRQRQLENWFSDEHSNIHARVTVMGAKGSEIVPQEKQMAIVNQLLNGLEDRLTLNGPPQMVGKNLRVTIRLMSAKEKVAYKKSIAGKESDKSK